MKITIIAGSHRQKAQSYKVAKYLQHQLEEREDVKDVELIDLGGNPIPLWDDTYWQEDTAIKEELAPYMKMLSSSDGLILIAPEWGGMAPAGLKNFMLYWSQKETGHKPVMLVGVSASINGAYPIAELRHSGYKNSKIVYTPEHIIVRNVQNMMNDMDPNGGEGFDKDIRERASHALNCLVVYSKAFKDMRDTHGEELFNKKFINGM